MALKITINAFDISGNPTAGIEEYQYLDLSVKNGDFFGSNKAIVMSDIVTRIIKIEKVIVVFEEGEQLLIGNDLQPIPKQEKLSNFLSSDLLEQYQTDVSAASEYVPQIYDSLWLCSCGNPNASNVCANCHATKDIVFNLYNPNLLNERLHIRLAQQQERAEAKKKQEATEKAKQKKKIKMFIIIGIAVVLLLVAVLAINAIKEQKEYNALLAEIDSYIEQERYEEAFDLINIYDITYDDKDTYREKLIPLMRAEHAEIRNSAKENLAFCLNGTEYYVSSYEIYSLKNGKKTILYEDHETGESLGIFSYYTLSYKHSLYANGCLFFVESCEWRKSGSLDENYEYTLKCLNLETGSVESIAQDDGYANIYAIMKLENGSIYVGFDYWHEKDGVIFNPYTQSKYEGKDVILDWQLESAIYKN